MNGALAKPKRLGSIELFFESLKAQGVTFQRLLIEILILTF